MMKKVGIGSRLRLCWDCPVVSRASRVSDPIPHTRTSGFLGPWDKRACTSESPSHARPAIHSESHLQGWSGWVAPDRGLGLGNRLPSIKKRDRTASSSRDDPSTARKYSGQEHLSRVENRPVETVTSGRLPGPLRPPRSQQFVEEDVEVTRPVANAPLELLEQTPTLRRLARSSRDQRLDQTIVAQEAAETQEVDVGFPVHTVG